MPEEEIRATTSTVSKFLSPIPCIMAMDSSRVTNVGRSALVILCTARGMGGPPTALAKTNTDVVAGIETESATSTNTLRVRPISGVVSAGVVSGVVADSETDGAAASAIISAIIGASPRSSWILTMARLIRSARSPSAPEPRAFWNNPMATRSSPR